MNRHTHFFVLSGLISLCIFFGTNSVVAYSSAAAPSTSASNTTAAPAGGGADTSIMKAWFMIDTKTFSPNTTSIKDEGGATGTKGLANGIIAKIANVLLVIIPLFAVLSIIVGGIFMITAGESSERASKGKTIIKLNIIALILSLMSYSIVQLVLWILKS